MYVIIYIEALPIPNTPTHIYEHRPERRYSEKKKHIAMTLNIWKHTRQANNCHNRNLIIHFAMCANTRISLILFSCGKNVNLFIV
jgi:hypothetical protein